MDVIAGKVVQILDGDTFDMRVEQVGTRNAHTYNHAERVRLAGVDAPELGSVGGYAAKARLQQRLGGRGVLVAVHARDVFRRIVGSVRQVR